MMGFVNRFRIESRLSGTGRRCKLRKSTCQVRYCKAAWYTISWFTDLSKSGGGPVIDLGVHAIDVTWYYMGKLSESVSA